MDAGCAALDDAAICYDGAGVSHGCAALNDAATCYDAAVSKNVDAWSANFHTPIS